MPVWSKLQVEDLGGKTYIFSAWGRAQEITYEDTTGSITAGVILVYNSSPLQQGTAYPFLAINNPERFYYNLTTTFYAFL